MMAARTTIGAVLASVMLAACQPGPAVEPAARLRVADVLGAAPAAGFERALEPRELAFPADHGPHPGFRSEWWYFTGNLRSAAGRRFGYQLTFFRTALHPPGAAPPRTSAWATDQVWMAHFAITDAGGGRFFAFDRFQRQALGLAGARSEPWRVWLDDWSLEQTGAGPFPIRLRARAGGEDAAGPAGGSGAPGGVPVDAEAAAGTATAAGPEAGGTVAIDLELAPLGPPVLHGDRGLSRKGPTPGNASFYYSYSRLRSAGTIVVVGAAHAVEGNSWLDREWSTSALEGDLVGWDWFGLQLDDGRELMFYRLRRADGSAAPASGGTLVGADRSVSPLDAADVDLQVRGTWGSPIDGTRYPNAWTLSLPAHGIVLEVEPLLAGQELDLAFRYWEGAVSVAGRGPGGAPLSGSGYVELTGYAEGQR